MSENPSSISSKWKISSSFSPLSPAAIYAMKNILIFSNYKFLAFYWISCRFKSPIIKTQFSFIKSLPHTRATIASRGGFLWKLCPRWKEREARPNFFRAAECERSTFHASIVSKKNAPLWFARKLRRRKCISRSAKTTNRNFLVNCENCSTFFFIIISFHRPQFLQRKPENYPRLISRVSQPASPMHPQTRYNFLAWNDASFRADEFGDSPGFAVFYSRFVHPRRTRGKFGQNSGNCVFARESGLVCTVELGCVTY